MTRRIYACVFDAKARGPFARMAAVLEASAARHCPDWHVLVERLAYEARPAPSGMDTHSHNTQKLEAWARAVLTSADGDELLLMDADTVILRSIDEGWQEPFDLAYTVKPAPPEPFPFNLGVLFVRVSARTRAWMRAWLEENARLFASPGDHKAWRRQWGGINQAAFGQLLTRGGCADLVLLERSCADWNCEESGWATFDPARTRIVHLKGELRRLLFPGPLIGHHPCAPLARRWLELEAEAQSNVRRPA